MQDIAFGLASLLMLLVMLLVMPLAWILPIVFGVRTARRKKISPHWMWFGVHPVGAWVAFLIIQWGVKRVYCPSCEHPILPKENFCPKCREPLSEGFLKQNSGVLRIRGSGIRCGSCHVLVKFDSTFCPGCSAPAPRMICPSCGRAETSVKTSRAATIIAAIVCLLVFQITGSAFSVLIGSKPPRPGMLEVDMDLVGPGSKIIAGVMMFASLSLTAWLFYRAFSRHSRRIVCSACSRVNKLDPRNQKIADVPKTEKPGEKGIRLKCTGCGIVAKVKSEFAGKKVKCRKCGTSFLVPTAG